MIQVQNISFSYTKTEILKHISFAVKPGEQLSIIGESGSGKSTLLKLLYGEYDLDSGHMFWGDTEILGPKYNLVVGYDFMKYVAQEFDLMPFTSVAENIGAFLSNFYPEEKQERVKELMEVVELTDFEKVKVKTLSGGQKQRVALARALAKEPEIMLLDEPFSHIDNFKKQSLRRNVFKYLKLKNIACVVATHDKEDVLGFADRMLILNNGKVEVEGTPEALFKNPKNPLIASFFGEFNVIENKIIYAYQIEKVAESELRAIVSASYFKGNYYLIEANLNGESILFQNEKRLDVGELVALQIK